MRRNHWNRKAVFEFIGNEVYPMLTERQGLFVDKPLELAKKIECFRRENYFPRDMIAELRDGVLYINGKMVGRITIQDERVPFSETAYYLEGKILERQEVY